MMSLTPRPRSRLGARQRAGVDGCRRANCSERGGSDLKRGRGRRVQADRQIVIFWIAIVLGSATPAVVKREHRAGCARSAARHRQAVEELAVVRERPGRQTTGRASPMRRAMHPDMELQSIRGGVNALASSALITFCHSVPSPQLCRGPPGKGVQDARGGQGQERNCVRSVRPSARRAEDRLRSAGESRRRSGSDKPAHSPSPAAHSQSAATMTEPSDRSTFGSRGSP